MSTPRSSDPFKTLVREHHAAVYRAAWRIVQNVDDAQDITQEVFVQALEKRELLDDAESPHAVLCWMASRTALMFLRGDRRRRRREVERAVMTREDQARDVREVKLEQEERKLFDRIYRHLPEELRIAISLRFQAEMTFEQIGEVMTVSVASAHDRVRRGLERMREGLKRGGLGAFAAGLERHLAEAPPAPVPPGLAERLLGLNHATMASGSLLVLGSVLAGIAVLGGGIGFAVLLGDEPAAMDEPIAVVVEAVEREAIEPPPADPAFPVRVDLGDGTAGIPATPLENVARERSGELFDAPKGWISGRITVPDGCPAVGVDVVANSYVLANNRSSWGGISVTDANGCYRLLVPVRLDGGEDYRVSVRYDDVPITWGRDARVPPGGTVSDFDISLERPLEEREGDFELDLEVRNEEGMLLPADSVVILYRNLRTIGEGTKLRQETSGRLDAKGRVLLGGSLLGPKKVAARLPGQAGGTVHTATFELEQAGRSARVVTVAPESSDYDEPSAMQPAGERPDGYSMTGTMIGLATGKPVERSCPDVKVYPVPELPGIDYHYDFLPNLLFRNSSQAAARGEASEVTNRFQLRVREPGRYVAVGYEASYAPAISAIVLLSEELPAVEGLQLRFEPAGKLTGVVRDVDGEPLEGAIIFITGRGPISTEKATELDGKIRRNAGEGYFIEPIRRTDEKGRFEIDGLPSTVPVRVMAFHPERAPATSPITYAGSGAALTRLQLRFTTVRER